MNTYIHEDVNAVIQLQQKVLEQKKHLKIGEFLNALSDNLAQSLQAGDQRSTIEIQNYHPLFAGHSRIQILESKPGYEVCQETILHEFGFSSFDEIPEKLTLDTPFEAAVDCLMEGKTDHLRNLLSGYPALAHARSAFGHQATLLHYAATNGVELFRQKLPLTMPHLVSELINAGANLHATAKFYGGQHTPHAMAATSSHPEQAGIAAELLTALQA